MLVFCPVSIGELVDKLTILLIKQKKIHDTQKRIHIDREVTELKLILEKSMDGQKMLILEPFSQKLEEINHKLWEIEDEIRDCENNQDFGDHFISLARSVYQVNDQRFMVKKEINQKFDSSIQEVKFYKGSKL